MTVWKRYASGDYRATFNGHVMRVYLEDGLRGWSIDIDGSWEGSSCHMYCAKNKALDLVTELD